MTFTLPKSLKDVNSMATPTVIQVELNDLDIDRLMNQLLELAVKRGRRATSRVDATAYPSYLSTLQQSPSLTGFESDRGREVLDGWIRSSVLVMQRGGRARNFAQMGYIRPLTIAAYRSGLPKTRRHRRADSQTYSSMDRVLRNDGVENPSSAIEQLFSNTFGTGVDVGVSPWATPRYDGTATLDIDTMLALRFLEGFTGSTNLSKDPVEPDPPVPEASDPLGRDVIDLLRHFGPTMPVAEAYLHLSAVVGLRLFQLPLITARHVRNLLNCDPTPKVNPSEMYCDFVRRRGSASDELSRSCVVRDLEVMRSFFSDRLLLRSVADCVALLPNGTLDADTASGRLRQTAELRDDPGMGMALRMKLQEIYLAFGDTELEGREFIEVQRRSDVGAADQLAAVLVEGLRKQGLENQMRWFYSTGGIDKPYGVLAGTRQARSTWRYAPSDECLMSLLTMCFVEAGGHRTSSRLPIRDVLDRFESRYGILIDRPPADLDSADARAGASENLTAFTRQLQLLGCFQGLSDDFSAQFVNRPKEVVP